MAKAFDTWTVLPHKPIEKVTDNLWRVAGTMPNGRSQRQMVLARMDDGRLMVHNAIALGEQDMGEIEAWGTPSVLFVPNGFHRQDAGIWKKRYPQMTVVAPVGSRKKVEQVVAVDALPQEAPHDDRVRLVPLEGLPMEAVMEVRSGGEVSLVFTDALLNLKRTRGIWGFLLAPTGRVSVPRYVRWISVKDKAAFAAHLQRLAATPGLSRVLVGHGHPVTEDPAGALRAAAEMVS